jgi:hypothetical protein
MTSPSLQLRCDSCLSATFLYRLYGTPLGLCAECFALTYPPESTAERRLRRAGSAGPAAAGCLRGLRRPRSAGGGARPRHCRG